MSRPNLTAPYRTWRSGARGKQTGAMARRQDSIAGVRELCLGLPEVNERLSHGAPTWFIRDKKTFATAWDNHHGDQRLGLICAAPPGVQQQLVDEEPDRFYVPAYVGHRGWIGVRIDRKIALKEVEQILIYPYSCVAPATVVAQLTRQSHGGGDRGPLRRD